MGKLARTSFQSRLLSSLILCVFLLAVGAPSKAGGVAELNKLPMQADGITRLSKIEVYPEHLEEYLKYAVEVGQTSLEKEPGVLAMYALAEKDNPCRITILEIYASQDSYKAHIASPHFQKYKQGTLKMVKSLDLVDQRPLNPANRIVNYIDKAINVD